MTLTEEEKQELERDVLLLKESMEILHKMIGEQGTTLDRVEEDTNKTTGLVVLGTNQIESAEGYTGFYVAAAGILGLIGSVLIGSNDFIKKARRVRKVFGGGMRQAGFIAAAGLYALKNNVNRLKVDHEHAKRLEKELIQLDWIKDILPVQTNIVVIQLKNAESRDMIINQLRSKGILIMAFGPGMLRIVTHLDICESEIESVIHAFNTLNV